MNFVNLTEQELRAIIARANQVFLSQPMLLELDSPVKVVADIHGQFVDLLRIFEQCGWPPKSNYLFLGDMVDRCAFPIDNIYPRSRQNRLSGSLKNRTLCARQGAPTDRNGGFAFLLQNQISGKSLHFARESRIRFASSALRLPGGMQIQIQVRYGG